MSIASATSKSGPYAGNGVTTAFALAFACFATADLSVVRTDAAGVDTLLALGTDYAVSLNADQTNSPGGTVTLVVAPAAGLQVTILRNVALTQGTQLPNQGGWYPQVVEKAFDKLTMIVQQLSEKVGRSVQVGVTTADTAALVAAINAVPANATSAASSAAAAAASAASVASALPAKGADVASAATINLTATSGDFVHVTGTTTISTITIPVGAQRTIVFDGALTLTHGAALLLPGAANLTTAAGDRLVVRGDTAGANVVSYTRANGTAVASSAGMSQLASATVVSAVASIDFLNVFSSGYDNYLIVLEGIQFASGAQVALQLAVAGAAVSSASYPVAYLFASSATANAGTNAAPGYFQTVTNATAGATTGGEIKVQNANNSGAITLSAHLTSYAAPTPQISLVSGIFTAAGVASGFKLLSAAAVNFTAGTVKVFGYKN